jgi:hypothetical protein
MLCVVSLEHDRPPSDDEDRVGRAEIFGRRIAECALQKRLDGVVIDTGKPLGPRPLLRGPGEVCGLLR